VFLRGLTAYINTIAEPNSRDEILQQGRNLVDAALTAFPDTENVMHESQNNYDWGNDLATGKGVFMRLVTRFVKAHNFFDDPKFKEKYKAFVLATAESAWCSRKSPETGDKSKWLIAPNWNPPNGPSQENDYPISYANDPGALLYPQVLQTNGLDALNAAHDIGG
jgi:hypothetical protein